MTPEEWLRLAIKHLDMLDDAELEKWGTEQPEADLFVDLIQRHRHAETAFPGMSFAEFQTVDAARHRAGRRGRPPRGAEARAKHPLWLAARDADRLKQLWRDINLDSPRSRPPVHPHEIAGQRHGYTKEDIGEAVRRPNSRRLDRIAAPK